MLSLMTIFQITAVTSEVLGEKLNFTYLFFHKYKVLLLLLFTLSVDFEVAFLWY